MQLDPTKPISSDELTQAEITAFAEAVTVYKDEHIWLVNKPAGLLSVPGRVLKDSLLSRLERADENVKLIHRLDMDTSGLLVFAIGKAAQTHISKQFIARSTDKVYEALVLGTLTGDEHKQGTVNVPVRYEPALKPRHIVDKDWKKHALTAYEVLHHELVQGTPVTRVKLIPITGRSHQLRVHMEYLGHVMLGDPIYAKDLQGDATAALHLMPRLALHAKSLTLEHPHTGKSVSFHTDVPF